MKVVDIEYDRRTPLESNGNLLGLGFLKHTCLFQFYPDSVLQWAENGEYKRVARFKITKLHNVRNK